MDADSSKDKKPTSPDHFDKLHESLRESSARHSRLLMTFVLALLYLLITVASTTDLQLLLPDSRIKLPILSVELPLFGFYIVAPALVLILHFSFLLHLLHHSKKLKAWSDAATGKQLVLMPGFILNYTFASREVTVSYKLLRILQVVVLGLAPLLLLLYIQVRYADYHSVPMTTWHFVVVGLDVFILIVYWYRIIDQRYLGRDYDSFRELWRLYFPKRVSGHHPRRGVVRTIWGFVNPIREASVTYMRLFCLILVLSATCLTVVILVTCDYFEKHRWYIPRLGVQGQTLVKSPPSDIIIHAYLTKGLSADSAWIDHSQGIDLRGRDLRFADLSRSNLLNGLLQNVRLNGASLMNAELHRAHLDSAELNRADLTRANLNGANLIEAELNGADLYNAKLNGAYLSKARLNGAYLVWTELNGASLDSAKLNGALLLWAQLNGANLRSANLHGAYLRGTELNGADLSDAELNGVDLSDAELFGADLGEARLNGTQLAEAKLNGAYLEQTRLKGSRGIIADATEGVFFHISIDSVSTPNWESLTADSILIPNDRRRKRFLSRLKTAQACTDSAITAPLNLQSDSIGFVEARRQLACQNTWAAYGLLRQWIGDSTFTSQLRERLMEQMYSNCPDKIELVRSRLEDSRYYSDDRLREQIDSFMRKKKAEESP